jgi:hypothetical protein
MPALGKPKPFQRPGINLDVNTTREWRNVTWHEIKTGDTVADYGTVRAVVTNDTGVIVNFDHRTEIIPNTLNHTVFAFVRVDG